MTVVNQTVGWGPERTEATFYTSVAFTKGDVVRLNSRYSQTNAAAEPTGGYHGFTRAMHPTSADQHMGACYGIALETVAAGSYVRVCLRGVVDALVEKDATDIAANKPLASIFDETTDVNALTLATDLNASAATVSPSSVKIIAIAQEANTSTTAAVNSVIFNGIEGFGAEVGATPA